MLDFLSAPHLTGDIKDLGKDLGAEATRSLLRLAFSARRTCSSAFSALGSLQSRRRALDDGPGTARDGAQRQLPAAAGVCSGGGASVRAAPQSDAVLRLHFLHHRLTLNLNGFTSSPA
jgi:hypothetical protein